MMELEVVQQHIEFESLFGETRISRVTSRVLKKVTMGLGAFIQSSQAMALVMAWGSISLAMGFSLKNQLVGTGLPGLTGCNNIKPFLNCGKSCNGTYSYGNILPFRKGYCQGQ